MSVRPGFKSVLGVIPARYGATRLPGKPLADIAGKPLVQWVYENARRALPNVVVATDDKRIADVVRGFGGEAMLTPESCKSGTDRMAWVARRRPAAYYANVQGDEPLLAGTVIRKSVELALKRKAVTTAVGPLDANEQNNPNVVKAVLGENDRAIYFSRSFIPYPRGQADGAHWKHVGLYVYPKARLFQFVKLKPPAMEKLEMLEQLRAIYHGMPIYVARTDYRGFGVDTPQDARRAAERLTTLSHHSR